MVNVVRCGVAAIFLPQGRRNRSTHRWGFGSDTEVSRCGVSVPGTPGTPSRWAVGLAATRRFRFEI